jgi:hypothetical protein
MGMSIPFSLSISVPADVLVNEVDGESVLLDLRSECYFGLDDVGTQVWKRLTGSGTIQAACESLLAEYEVDSELLRRDLMALVENLKEHGLVEVRPG